MNLSSIEEWVGQMSLPRGVQTHFTPVRELLNWLQVCLYFPIFCAHSHLYVVSVIDYRIP